MKLWTALALLASFALANQASAYPFHVQIERKPTQSNILGINRGYAPVTVVLDFSALAADKANVRAQDIPTTTRRIVVQPNKEMLLMELHPIDPSLPYWAKMKSKWYFGDESAKVPEPSTYRLPYPDGTSARSSRSLDSLHGNIKHQFDIDFELKDWTPVVAARAGVVFDVTEEQPDGVEQNQNGGEPHREDVLKGDYIKVLHDDGSYAEYANLMGSSALVRPGERIAEGQQIAYAGNSAQAQKSHLHFGVYRLVPITGAESMPWLLKFKEGQPIRPDPEQVYTADYSEQLEDQRPAPAPERTKQGAGRQDVGAIFSKPMHKPDEGIGPVKRPVDQQERDNSGDKPQQRKWMWPLMGLGLLGVLWYQRRTAGPKKEPKKKLENT